MEYVLERDELNKMSIEDLLKHASSIIFGKSTEILETPPAMIMEQGFRAWLKAPKRRFFRMMYATERQLHEIEYYQYVLRKMEELHELYTPKEDPEVAKQLRTLIMEALEHCAQPYWKELYELKLPKCDYYEVNLSTYELLVRASNMTEIRLNALSDPKYLGWLDKLQSLMCGVVFKLAPQDRILTEHEHLSSALTRLIEARNKSEAVLTQISMSNSVRRFLIGVISPSTIPPDYKDLSPLQISSLVSN